MQTNHLNMDRSESRLVPLIALLMGTLILTGLSSANAAAPQPTLAILSPGGLFNPSTTVPSYFQVAFAVTNFQITQPGLVNQTNQANQGHILAFLDDNFYAIWATPNPIVFQMITPGSHTIMVQLVNNDNSALYPDVSTTIGVTVTAPIGVTVTAPPAGFNFTTILNAANNAATTAGAAKSSADSAGSAVQALGTIVQGISSAVQGVNSNVQGLGSTLSEISSSIQSIKSTQSSEDSKIASLQSASSSSTGYALAAVGISLVTLILVIYVAVRKK